MADKMVEILMSEYNFKKIIQEESFVYCREEPMQIRKAQYSDEKSAKLAFLMLGNRILKRVKAECITKCKRCGKTTRADILHTCSPGDWKPKKSLDETDTEHLVI